MHPLFSPLPRIRYLPIGRRDETEELVDMADAEPVGKQLHGSLHALGDQKIPDSFRHPPATESGGSTRKGLQFWGA